MPASSTNAIQNGLERSMKGGIIMARRSHAGRKTQDSQMLETDARLALIHAWLTRELALEVTRIEPASSDASFRRYFRAFMPEGTRIVMDAPPDKEDVRPYLKTSGLLEGTGVHVPHVHAQDPVRGLLLLEDLGTTLYLERLVAGDDPEVLYSAALDALVTIQVQGKAACGELAPYGRAELARELSLMPEWFLQRHLGLTLSAADARMLEESCELLIRDALSQPVVFVHRDYHSRNLMVVRERSPGIIDFQDALAGPVGYDLVSLLKDCYIAWPRERVVRWVDEFRARLRARGGAAGDSEAQFLRWFDLIGVQRHLKVLGIFCRLWYRDGKIGYLADLPRTLAYVEEACARYTELAPLSAFITAHVSPRLAEANARARAAQPAPARTA
jgi:N-acetylmuramate 1-kinase